MCGVGLVEPLVDQTDHHVVADQPAASITCLAAFPSSVPSRAAARSMSPVEMCGTT